MSLCTEWPMIFGYARVSKAEERDTRMQETALRIRTGDDSGADTRWLSRCACPGAYWWAPPKAAGAPKGRDRCYGGLGTEDSRGGGTAVWCPPLDGQPAPWCPVERKAWRRARRGGEHPSRGVQAP